MIHVEFRLNHANGTSHEITRLMPQVPGLGDMVYMENRQWTVKKVLWVDLSLGMKWEVRIHLNEGSCDTR